MKFVKTFVIVLEFVFIFLKTNESTKQKVNDRKMVSKPAPPRKHNTFNENQSAYYKDAKNKLALNLNQNKRENNQQSNKPNVDIIYFKKPVTRTGSTLMTVISLRNKIMSSK